MRWVAIALALVCACGPRTPRRGGSDDEVPWTRSEIDWTTPPAVLDVGWRPPPIGEHTLGNGVRIVVVENHRLPLVAVIALHGAAGSREDGQHPGLAALSSDLLARRVPLVIGTSIATDHATQDLVTTTERLPDAIKSLAGTMRRPQLTDENVRLWREKRLAELAQHRSQTRRVAAQVFDRVVFGAHPYAAPAEGSVASMQALSTSDVRRFWDDAYRPDRLIVILTGDISLARARELVDASFGDWQAPATPPISPPPLPAYVSQLAYVDVPGATEANIIVGRRAAAATSAPTLAGDIANSVLGGGVDGRLDRELHGRLALTFGASASFWRGAAAGSWAAAATFQTARAAEGIRALLAVLDDARTIAPTADELARARRDITTAAQRNFETTQGAARAALRLVTAELPLDTLTHLHDRLVAVTATQAQAALDLSDLSIVVVGDWSRLRDALDGLGMPATPYQP